MTMAAEIWHANSTLYAVDRQACPEEEVAGILCLLQLVDLVEIGRAVPQL